MTQHVQSHGSSLASFPLQFNADVITHLKFIFGFPVAEQRGKQAFAAKKSGNCQIRPLSGHNWNEDDFDDGVY